MENEETEVEVEGARGGFPAGIGEERGPSRCYIVGKRAALCVCMCVVREELD